MWNLLGLLVWLRLFVSIFFLNGLVSSIRKFGISSGIWAAKRFTRIHSSRQDLITPTIVGRPNDYLKVLFLPGKVFQINMEGFFSYGFFFLKTIFNLHRPRLLPTGHLVPHHQLEGPGVPGVTRVARQRA